MRRYRVPTVALALAVSSVLTLPGPSSDGSSGRTPAARPAAAVPAAAAAPLPANTRVGFTDEQDSLYETGVERDLFSTSGSDRYRTAGNPGSVDRARIAAGFAKRPSHDGEMSVSYDRAFEGGDPLSATFISTRQKRQGEIYVAYTHGSGEQALVRLTCNQLVESHPVVEGRYVVFAAETDGDWDIWLGEGPHPPGPPPPPVLGRPAPDWAQGGALGKSEPPVAAGAMDPCPGLGSEWEFHNLTGSGPDENDDLWPALTPDFDPEEALGQIVFSRSVDGALPDLWRMDVDDDNGEWQAPEPLAVTPDIAETQPAVLRLATQGSDAGEEWVLYTTTEHRDDGSLEFRRLWQPWEEPDDEAEPVDPWGERHPQQSSEGTWDRNSDRPVVAFRSTGEGDLRDPLGGIWLTELDLESGEPAFTQPTRVVDDPRVAESHPVFLTGFDDNGSPYEEQADLGYTARAQRHLHVESDRFVDGDVTEVFARDGSDRLVVADDRDETGPFPYRYHESAPSYSPDGKRMVYAKSDNNQPSGSSGRGELLVIADAGGRNAVSLGAATDHELGDIDSDPAFSPDGTRIAFVRHRPGEFRHVFVLEIATGDLVQVTYEEIGGEFEQRFADADPSWSPDGRRLVVAREALDSGEDFDEALAFLGRQELHVVPADGSGPGLRVVSPCDGLCPQEGRRPAWSPDGTRIAFELDGELLLTRIEEVVPEKVVIVSQPEVLVGFRSRDGEPEPSDARHVVEAGDDPAWAPDGSEIAFAGQPVGQPDQRGIWAIEPDGSGLRSVTDERGPETEPAYRPGRPAATPTADVLVRVRLDEPVGYAGGRRTATVVVRNRGPRVAQTVTLRAVWPDHLTPAVPPPTPPTPATPDCLAAGDPCALGSLAPGAVIRYDVLLATPAEGSGRIVARVSTTTRDVVPANNRAAVSLPVLQPTIRLVPAVARPGQVVMAYAENMPPGTSVGLRWSEGIVPEPGTLTVAEDGTARTSILFVRRDQLGERILTATSTTDEFAPVDGEILVTLRSMSPPDLVGRG